MSLIDKTLTLVRRALLLEPEAGRSHEPAEPPAYAASRRVDELDRVAAPLPATPAMDTADDGPFWAGVAEVEAPENVFSQDYVDLVSELGAEPPEPSESLELKNLEIAELQQNLKLLEPLGDELALVEQQRIAERAAWQSELDQLREQLSAADGPAPAAREVPERPPTDELHDVMELVGRLGRSLAEPPSSGAEQAPAAPEPAPGTLERMNARLETARARTAEQKQKAAQHWREVRRLRARSKEMQTELKHLRKQLRLARTPVRRLLLEADEPVAELARLAELLELDTE